MTGSKRVFLYKIPKTASSSIEEGLIRLQRSGAIKKCRSIGHGLPSKDRINKKITTLISVRNPYDRLLSAYRYIMENKNGNPPLEYVWSKTFEQFVKTLPKVYKQNRFFYPQTEWLLFDNKKTYTHIIHYETLESDWNSFVSHFAQKKITIPHIRPSKHKNWKQIYNQKMRDIVYGVYKSDFELLGYTP